MLLGDWRSWLARHVDIVEVIGSIPISPTFFYLFNKKYMKTINLKLISGIIAMLFFVNNSFSQVYSSKDIINLYDPFTITLNDMTLNTNDEEIKEHLYVLIVTINVGNEKIIKFLNKDDLTINSMKNYDDVYWALNITPKRNNIILVPALFNIPNNAASITIKLQGYSNLNEMDQITMNQLSTSYCYTSSSMYYAMEQAYKFLASGSEISRANNGILTTAEVLQQNLKTRPEIFYVSNPIELTYSIPVEPKKVLGPNILIQGKKSIESKLTLRSSDIWNITFTKLPDVKIVQNESYYIKIKGVFQDLTSQQSIPDLKREGFLAKAQEVINDDLVMGLKSDVYMNDQVIKQLTNLLNFLKAGVKVKSDTLETTNETMLSHEREALSYIETCLKENDFNLDNQYIYDDYIASSVNRGILQKEVDLIRKYYQIK